MRQSLTVAELLFYLGMGEVLCAICSWCTMASCVARRTNILLLSSKKSFQVKISLSNTSCHGISHVINNRRGKLVISLSLPLTKWQAQLTTHWERETWRIKLIQNCCKWGWSEPYEQLMGCWWMSGVGAWYEQRRTPVVKPAPGAYSELAYTCGITCRSSWPNWHRPWLSM